jgi:hypothetical protein
LKDWILGKILTNFYGRSLRKDEDLFITRLITNILKLCKSRSVNDVEGSEFTNYDEYLNRKKLSGD